MKREEPKLHLGHPLPLSLFRPPLSLSSFLEFLVSPFSWLFGVFGGEEEDVFFLFPKPHLVNVPFSPCISLMLPHFGPFILLNFSIRCLHNVSTHHFSN